MECFPLTLESLTASYLRRVTHYLKVPKREPREYERSIKVVSKEYKKYRSVYFGLLQKRRWGGDG